MTYPVDVLALWSATALFAGIILIYVIKVDKSPYTAWTLSITGMILLVSVLYCAYDYWRGPTIAKEYHTYWTDVIVSTLRGTPTHRRVTTDQEVGCSVIETTTYKYIRLIRNIEITNHDGVTCSSLRIKDNTTEVTHEQK